jgi:hypothetical protein
MGSTPVVAPILHGAVDVAFLRALVATAEQDHYGSPLAAEIDP